MDKLLKELDANRVKLEESEATYVSDVLGMRGAYRTKGVEENLVIIAKKHGLCSYLFEEKRVERPKKKFKAD